jgi:ribA/ribD-fused uncharacterized protein
MMMLEMLKRQGYTTSQRQSSTSSQSNSEWSLNKKTKSPLPPVIPPSLPPVSSSSPPPPFVLLFHSKSAKLKPKIMKLYGLPENAGQLLSNFAELPVRWRHHTYPTVEHAFQGAKYLFSNHPEIEKEFREGGAIGSSSPVEAKHAGSKTGMKKKGAIMSLSNIQEWDAQKEGIMRELIEDKVKRHPVLRDILKSCAKHRIPIVHFSRTNMEWGCHLEEDGLSIKKGNNKLGNMYMQIS